MPPEGRDRKIELTYDLFSLPTAPHKAGLAGLCVLYESLKRRGKSPLPKLSFPETGVVRVQLTEGSLETLFNDLYDAAVIEMGASKEGGEEQPEGNEEWPGKTRRKKDPAKEKKVKTWQAVVPRAAFLTSFQMPEVWVKLWREALWATLRAQPKTRIPYNQRAEGKSVSEIGETWKSLFKFIKGREKNLLVTQNLAGSLFLGAQAANAERVPFLGRVDENFVLHFWPVVMRVFVPEVLDMNGSGRFKGYVIAIPEISDLQEFISEFIDLIPQLDGKAKRFRPAESLISLPEEGALEYMRSLLAITKVKSHDGDITVSGVEAVHLERRGNICYVLGVHRINFDANTLEQYQVIRERYRHPIFKAQMIRNLLRGDPWYGGFGSIFSQFDKDSFIGFKTDFPEEAGKRIQS